jgi:hypothetical protein
MSKNQHVVPSKNGWAIKTEGSSDRTPVFDSKQEAIDVARSIAHRQGGRLIVHGLEGQIFRSNGGSGISEATLRAAVRSVSSASFTKRTAKKKSAKAKKSSSAKKSSAKKPVAKKLSRKK